MMTLAMIGCAIGPPGTPGTVQTATFNDKAGLALITVTTLRKSFTAATAAGKMSVADDVKFGQALDKVVAGVATAKAIQSNDPAGATKALTEALNDLNKVQTDSGVKAP